MPIKFEKRNRNKMKSTLGLTILLNILIPNILCLPTTSIYHRISSLGIKGGGNCRDCLNGGSCIYLNNTSHCQCASCYSGLNCETSIYNI